MTPHLLCYAQFQQDYRPVKEHQTQIQSHLGLLPLCVVHMLVFGVQEVEDAPESIEAIFGQRQLVILQRNCVFRIRGLQIAIVNFRPVSVGIHVIVRRMHLALRMNFREVLQHYNLEFALKRLSFDSRIVLSCTSTDRYGN